MTIKGIFNITSFELDKDNSPDVWTILNEYIDDENVIYNQEELLFLEERYIEECHSFKEVLNKFKKKKFDSKLSIFKENEIKKIEDYSQEVVLYKLIINENNINNLRKEDLNISIKHFKEYEKNNRTAFIQFIYIMLFISNSTDYDDNHFTFKVSIEDNAVKKEVPFNESQFYRLEDIYFWITESKENINTRLNIIRKLIVTKNTFNLDEKDLNTAKSCFNRIINEETEKYFEQVNILKEDFLKLNYQRQKAYQSLHLKFLGWGASVALFIYEELKNIPSEKVWSTLLYSSSEKTKLFLMIFIATLVLIWVIFNKEVKENQKEFNQIKQLYLKGLYFIERDEEILNLDVPKVPILYICFFLIIIIVLLIRLTITFL